MSELNQDYLNRSASGTVPTRKPARKPKRLDFGTPVTVTGPLGWPEAGGEVMDQEPGVLLALRKVTAEDDYVRRHWVYYVGFRSGASRWVLPEFVTTTEEKP